MSPEERGCLFPDETDRVTIHRRYTRSNCYVECGLKNARLEIQKAYGITCSPWNFPFFGKDDEFCDPWVAVDFYKHLQRYIYCKIASQQVFSNLKIHNLRIDDDTFNCSHCLPDCIKTLYQPTVTSSPFRKCNNNNIGVTRLKRQ